MTWGSMSRDRQDLKRIADALERIVVALEGAAGKPEPSITISNTTGPFDPVILRQAKIAAASKI